MTSSVSTPTSSEENRSSHLRSTLLLSPKSLEEYSPDEFREYVRSLYAERKKKVAAGKAPSKTPGLTLRQSKTGTWILTSRRPEKYVLRSEIDYLSAEKKIPLNELWLLFREKGYAIYASQEEYEDIKKFKEDIPW